VADYRQTGDASDHHEVKHQLERTLIEFHAFDSWLKRGAGEWADKPNLEGYEAIAPVERRYRLGWQSG
jgi:hypothetical protein